MPMILSSIIFNRGIARSNIFFVIIILYVFVLFIFVHFSLFKIEYLQYTKVFLFFQKEGIEQSEKREINCVCSFLCVAADAAYCLPSFYNLIDEKRCCLLNKHK